MFLNLIKNHISIEHSPIESHFLSKVPSKSWSHHAPSPTDSQRQLKELASVGLTNLPDQSKGAPSSSG
ncbi:hypothetical protein HOH30_02275 [Candidatus Woesearchaeota archaeon]|nr:hypothetical protein [Candidatus Woesearchaeota archaeon]